MKGVIPDMFGHEHVMKWHLLLMRCLKVASLELPGTGTTAYLWKNLYQEKMNGGKSGIPDGHLILSIHWGYGTVWLEIYFTKTVLLSSGPKF